MSQNGKGSKPRPKLVDEATFASNWDATFGTKIPQEMLDWVNSEEANAIFEDALQRFHYLNPIEKSDAAREERAELGLPGYFQRIKGAMKGLLPWLR